MQVHGMGRRAIRPVSHQGFQQRGLYCQSLPDGSERWTAEDEHGHELADAMVYAKQDVGAVIDYLGRIAYGDDVESWDRPRLTVIDGGAGLRRSRSPARPDCSPGSLSPLPLSPDASSVVLP